MEGEHQTPKGVEGWDWEVAMICPSPCFQVRPVQEATSGWPPHDEGDFGHHSKLQLRWEAIKSHRAGSMGQLSCLCAVHEKCHLGIGFLPWPLEEQVLSCCGLYCPHLSNEGLESDDRCGPCKWVLSVSHSIACIKKHSICGLPFAACRG